MNSIAAAAQTVLSTAAPAMKISLTDTYVSAWRAGRLPRHEAPPPPLRPARPERPELRPPGEMPKRRIKGEAGRVALLHALAHIELNAIDLAWDMIARFDRPDLPAAFIADWLKVAEEEALHHRFLAERLATFGAAYGDLPAHDGLWQAAEATADDLLARLAVVPLVLEARGLDVTPAMIERLKGAGDPESAAVLEIIYRDEIGHVAIGKRWFDHVCTARGLPPKETWQDLVRRNFKGQLKPPFNDAGRGEANFPADFYSPLVEH